MTKKYGKIGTSQFQKGGTIPQDYVEIQDDKPITEGNWILSEDLNWIDRQPTQEELDLASVKEIDTKLVELDNQMMVPMQRIKVAELQGTTDEIAEKKLLDIESEKKILREERNLLISIIEE